MSSTFKRAVMAASVAAAMGVFSTNVFAIAGTQFDADGGGAAANSVAVTEFDWKPGHVMYSDCFGAGAIGVVGGCTIYAQGTIGTITKSLGGNLVIPAGVSYTFTLEVKATVTKPGGSGYDGKTVNLGENLIISDAGLGGTFKIYADASDNTNSLAGTGYNDGIAILTGDVSVVTFLIGNAAAAPQTFDQGGGDGDQYGGLLTHDISGKPNFNINVTSKDDAYFTDPLASFALQMTDATQPDGSTTPFANAPLNPAKLVNGVLFDYTPAGLGGTKVGNDGIVDIYCGSLLLVTCGGEAAGDASTSFKTTTTLPEPGALALLGLSLAGMGVFTRRNRKLAA
jgi:hypothetical protein